VSWLDHLVDLTKRDYLDDLMSDRSRSTREAIITAAWLCFQEKGPDKTTISAIARRAGVSRDTVYRYFSDSEAIFRATAEQVSQTFYAILADELAAAATLQEQIEHVAVFLCRSKQWVPLWGEAFDAERVALLTTIYSRVILGDFTAFLSPYLEIARVRGEIRADIDIEAAAEWTARLLFSVYSTPSPFRDLDDPEVTRQFVSDFAIAGLQGPPRAPSPPSAPAATAAVLDAFR
jgi:AcrR family transcriptional regulator